MLKTKEYYKILHFLKVESVDRIYPVEEYFYSVDEETGDEVPVVFDGDSFLFETNRQQFSGLDYVEVLLECSEDFTVDDIKCLPAGLPGVLFEQVINISKLSDDDLTIIKSFRKD